MEGGLYRSKQGGLDYSHDFFGKAAFLTVSGQLQAEYFATALSNVYTFAPTFRAEGHNPLGPVVDCCADCLRCGWLHCDQA